MAHFYSLVPWQGKVEYSITKRCRQCPFWNINNTVNCPSHSCWQVYVRKEQKIFRILTIAILSQSVFPWCILQQMAPLKSFISIIKYHWWHVFLYFLDLGWFDNLKYKQADMSVCLYYWKKKNKQKEYQYWQWYFFETIRFIIIV